MLILLVAISSLLHPCLSGVPSASPGSVGLDGKQLEKLDTFLHGYVEPKQGMQEIAGTTLAVARKGKVAHFKVDGEQVMGKAPMAEDTIFRYYSMTKPVTAVTLMTFWDEGRFLLDDPVSMYIPAFKNMRVLRTPSSPINDTVACAYPCMTIRHLLTHTAGLTYGWNFNISVDLHYYIEGGIPIPPNGFVKHKNLSLADWVSRVAEAPLLYQPGTTWHYSNAIDVCGYLVEVLAGEKFQTVVQKRILDPLGMTDTSFFVPKEKMSRLASNYIPPNGTTPLKDANDQVCATQFAAGSGGGGLCGTTMDYMRFAMMLGNGGEFQGVRILAPRTVRLLMANNIEGGKDLKALGVFPHDIWNTNCQLGAACQFFRNPSNCVRNWGGIGQGLGGQMIIDPVMAGLSTGKGSYYWGGAAGTEVFVNPEDDVVTVFMMQRQDDGPGELNGRMRAMVQAAIRDSSSLDAYLV